MVHGDHALILHCYGDMVPQMLDALTLTQKERWKGKRKKKVKGKERERESERGKERKKRRKKGNR